MPEHLNQEQLMEIHVVADGVPGEDAAVEDNEKKYVEAGELGELASGIDPYDYTYYQNAALAFANTRSR